MNQSTIALFILGAIFCIFMYLINKNNTSKPKVLTKKDIEKLESEYKIPNQTINYINKLIEYSIKTHGILDITLYFNNKVYGIYGLDNKTNIQQELFVNKLKEIYPELTITRTFKGVKITK